MDHLVIQPLASGFVIKTWDGRSYNNPVLAAGCSNFYDLVDALRTLIGQASQPVASAPVEAAAAAETPVVDAVQASEPVEPEVSVTPAADAPVQIVTDDSAVAAEPQASAEPAPFAKHAVEKPQPIIVAAAPAAVGEPKNAHKRVYDHLLLCAQKSGEDVVTISLATLADKAGCAKGSISFIVNQLAERGLIERIARGTAEAAGFKVIGGPKMRGVA